MNGTDDALTVYYAQQQQHRVLCPHYTIVSVPSRYYLYCTAAITAAKLRLVVRCEASTHEFPLDETDPHQYTYSRSDGDGTRCAAVLRKQWTYRDA
jgi:hypothetical protein